ncbi:MAG: glycosyltransferase family 2 protein [Bacteroidota bacterium]
MSFFSIIIPTYNRAKLLAKTLQSIQSQTFLDYEVIVVDDGGSDDTQQVVEGLQDERFQYIWKENEERAIARNFGAKKAEGAFFTFHDSDDLLEPNHLSVVFDFIQAHPQARFLATERAIVSTNGSIISKSHLNAQRDVNRYLIRGNALACLGVFIERGLFLKEQFPTNPALRKMSEDWHLWLRLASRNKLWIVPQLTAFLCEHDQRSVNTNQLSDIIESQDALTSELLANRSFCEFYEREVPIFKAHNLTLVSLYAAIAQPTQRTLALSKLMKAIQAYPPTLFKRRTLAILKHLIT